MWMSMRKDIVIVMGKKVQTNERIIYKIRTKIEKKILRIIENFESKQIWLKLFFLIYTNFFVQSSDPLIP